jgi:hypothetical protein
MLQTNYFRKNGLREANKRDLFVRVHLRNMYPASYELHYFEERLNSEPELIYPVLLMTISSTPFSQELVLPCLAKDYSSGMLTEFFVSRGYEDGTFFVHERSTNRYLFPVAIMERGRALVDFADHDFEAEDHYVEHRLLLGTEFGIYRSRPNDLKRKRNVLSTLTICIAYAKMHNVRVLQVFINPRT